MMVCCGIQSPTESGIVSVHARGFGVITPRAMIMASSIQMHAAHIALRHYRINSLSASAPSSLRISLRSLPEGTSAIRA